MRDLVTNNEYRVHILCHFYFVGLKTNNTSHFYCENSLIFKSESLIFDFIMVTSLHGCARLNDGSQPLTGAWDKIYFRFAPDFLYTLSSLLSRKHILAVDNTCVAT